jgi:predicted ferric reductase
MSTVKKWLFPLIALFIYGTLLGAFLLNKPLLPAGQQLPIALGLLVFTLALTEIFIALRPKKLERMIGLPLMYSIHGVMAIVLIIAAIAHIGSELMQQKDFAVMPSVTPTGIMAMTLLVLTTLTGVFILSNAFTKNSRVMKRLKGRILKRETGLWVHRLSILAVLVIFVHMMSVEFVRSNAILSVLSSLYVLLAVVGYIGSNVAKKLLPRYVLQSNTQLNPSVFALEFKPQKGALMCYQSGQYVFARFLNSELPKESHPFSISSSPKSSSATLQLIIKNSGDYTSQINKLKSGDIATLEGPYGSFLDEITSTSNTPIVLLAGGIGITPILSILRSQIEISTSRNMVLVWGLNSQNDLLLLHELEQMKQQNAHFSFFITFSNEHVDTFDYGRITQEYLQRVGVDKLYPKADFFICGPAPMMDSMKKILEDNRVPPNKIHIEEFSF